MMYSLLAQWQNRAPEDWADLIHPVRLAFVSRPRLIQRLDDGLRQGRRLTLVSSPADYGKTTLLSKVGLPLEISEFGVWIGVGQHTYAPGSGIGNPSSRRLASLDEADNDPAYFWTYLIAALQTAHPHMGQFALQTLQSPQFPAALPASILPSLLNEIAAPPERVVLVLDDYHVISTQAIHAGIAFLLQH